MKILGYVASPRKNGNTAWLVNNIIKSATEQGSEANIYYSSDMNIKPCQGCLVCIKNQKCVIKDDMQRVYSDLIKADTLILGSPNYMGQMSAQAKIFTDRLFAMFKPRFSPQFKEEFAGKKLVLVITQGNPEKDKFNTYYEYTKNMFALLEFKVKNIFVVSGTRNEHISEREDLFNDIRLVVYSLLNDI